jgi:hypothetical protein
MVSWTEWLIPLILQHLEELIENELLTSFSLHHFSQLCCSRDTKQSDITKHGTSDGTSDIGSDICVVCDGNAPLRANTALLNHLQHNAFTSVHTSSSSSSDGNSNSDGEGVGDGVGGVCRICRQRECVPCPKIAVIAASGIGQILQALPPSPAYEAPEAAFVNTDGTTTETTSSRYLIEGSDVGLMTALKALDELRL